VKYRAKLQDLSSKLRLSEGPPVGSRKTARIRRCRVTFFELVHLCNMVERCPRASTSESAVFSENADPFRQRAIAGARGPGGPLHVWSLALDILAGLVVTLGARLRETRDGFEAFSGADQSGRGFSAFI
jgi:hypothetical protein